MTATVSPREGQAPFERVKLGPRPKARALAVQIEGEFGLVGSNTVAAQANQNLARAQTADPSPIKVSPLAAMLAKLFGSAATNRDRTRQEVYQEQVRGYGNLTGVTYPRC